MKKKTKIFLLQFFILLVICRVNSTLFYGFIWAIVHEVAHIVAANKFGIRYYNVKLHIAGVKAEIKDLDDLTDNKKLVVFFAGPLLNLLIAIIFMFSKDFYNIQVGKQFININLCLFLFNILPAYPLDGIRIMEIILGKKFLYKKTKKILTNISFGISIVILILFCSTVYIHKANFSLLLAAFLITYATFLEKEKTMYIIMGNIFKKRGNILKHDYMENRSISLYYKKDLIKVLSLLDNNKFNTFFVLDEELQLLGILYENEIINALKEYGNITLEELLRIKVLKN
ncbi:MAG: peptidase M50 [Clostridiaceae bacterium]|nr:peptidase M50 [Clostridiaceae bacterium]